MKLAGTHTHKTLGDFAYEAEYAISRPESTWLVDWSGTVVGAGRLLDLEGGRIEIIVGAPGAASRLVEEQIRKEIDALS